MKWTHFWDMHSGGGRKLDWENIFIEAPTQKLAEAIFEDKFGRDPNNVTCECCGDDYAIMEYDSLTEATEYHRLRKGQTLEEYFADPGNSAYRIPLENS